MKYEHIKTSFTNRDCQIGIWEDMTIYYQQKTYFIFKKQIENEKIKR